MTTLSDARRAYREALEKYQERTPSRVAVLGDGRGTASSNVLVPGRPDYVYARDDVTSTRFFQVLNQGAVQPAANLPVYVGYPFPTGTGSDEEQVIRINYSGLGDISSGTVPPVGPHHQQHEFRGGDDILLDSRQFLPGLVHPTDPVSMQVQVESFIYFWDTWRRWEITRSKDLTEYLPSSGYILWVMIALDPETGQLVYRPGVPFATGSQDVILGTFTPVPAPAGNELPLGYVRLASTTTTIDWTSSADNIGDARLWVNPPMLHILDRIEQLEGISGNPPDLMMMGAATNLVGEATSGNSGTGTTNYIARWASGTVLGTGVMYDTGSNIGVNNTSPNYRLDVVASASQIRFGTGATDDGGFLFSVSAGTALLAAGASHNGTDYVAKRTTATVVFLSGSSLFVQNDTGLIVGNTFTPTVRLSISPTQASYTQAAATAGVPTAFTVTGGAHTTLLASTELIDIDFDMARTVEWATGAITTQRFAVFQAPTLAFVGASTVTTAATVAVTGAPVAGTNATITLPLAFWVQAGKMLMGSASQSTAFTSVLEVNGSITTDATATVAHGMVFTATLTADANSRTFRGVTVFPVFATGTFTGLNAIGLRVTNQAITGSGTIDTYSAISAAEATIATANVGILIGTHPGGSTNYAIYSASANDSRFAGNLSPTSAAGANLGDATVYWNDVSYKTLTDRGCLGWFDSGVEMPDGRIVSDVEALTLIQKHPTLQTVYGVPRLDYSTMPRAVYKPANGKGDDGAETTALISILIGAIKELNARLSELEKQ